MVTQSVLGWTSLQPARSLCSSLSVCLSVSEQRSGLNVMAEDQRHRKEERKTEGEKERSCLPCSLGDSALASLQFTCTGLPKAAASQAVVPRLDSHWMGGAPPAPRATQQYFIGSGLASSWSSTSDWFRFCSLIQTFSLDPGTSCVFIWTHLLMLSLF